MEHNLTGDSGKECCSQGELLFSECQEGATKQNPGASEIPISLEGHLSPDSPSSENLEVLAETAGILDLKSIKKNCSGAAKKWARRARHTEAPPGTLLVANLSRAPPKGTPALQQLDTDPERAQNIWDPNKRERELPKCGPCATGPNFPNARGPHRALVNTRGRPGSLLWASRQRDSGRLGNRALPVLFGRASGWLSSVTATLRRRFTRKNL